MKILHLLGDPADLGGILSVVRCLHEVTTAQGDRHVVWVRRGYRETRQPALEYRYSRAIQSESPHHFELLWRALPALVELLRLLRSEPFDVVHGHTRGAFPIAILLSGLTRRPVIFTNHTYATRTAMYRHASRLPRLHHVVLTPNMAKHYGLAAPAPRVSIISECCRDMYFDGPLVQRPSGRAPAVLRLVGVGNIVRWKKWHLLVEALAQLPREWHSRIRFDHYGEAPADHDSRAYERELLARVGQAGLQSVVGFRGSTLDVKSKLLEADGFVLPSTNEPCSVALIEALALGLPALVSASGGNVDILSPGKTGLLFAPDDPADLASALRKMVQGQLELVEPAAIRRSVASRRATEVARLYRDLYFRIAPPSLMDNRGFVRSG